MGIIKDLRDQFHSRLAELYTPAEISHLWRIFIQEITGMSPLTASSKTLSDADSKRLVESIQRLAAGEPYQYILGHSPFDVLDLVVGPGVLIPRPETEELVELIKQQLEPQFISSALDIGTGSGCIALSLARYFRNAQVTAVDISETALAIAAENARRNELQVSFLRYDVLKDDAVQLPKVDLIVSNPPYIARKEAGSMDQRVLGHEPGDALFVEDNDPLIFYRCIENMAIETLEPKGRIYLELNAGYAAECRNLFVERGWRTELFKDMSGNQRFLKVWK